MMTLTLVALGISVLALVASFLVWKQERRLDQELERQTKQLQELTEKLKHQIKVEVASHD